MSPMVGLADAEAQRLKRYPMWNWVLLCSQFMLPSRLLNSVCSSGVHGMSSFMFLSSSISLSYSTALSWSTTNEFSLHLILCPVNITSSLSPEPTLNSSLSLSMTCLCISLDPANRRSSTCRQSTPRTILLLAALPVAGSKRNPSAQAPEVCLKVCFG